MNYYNEFDPAAAAWLRELIRAGLIPAGEVDERSIADVKPGDLAGFTQCHFFAGIGGWPYAMQLAGWPKSRRAWSGSCPCQPFSDEGELGGFDDPRHLWPEFYRLIVQCRPPTVFGEQVASSAALKWLDRVCADLESSNYAVAAADLPAACVEAPNRRQRLFWVAHANDADAYQGTSSGEQPLHEQDAGAGYWSAYERLICNDGKVRRVEPGAFPLAPGIPSRMDFLRGYGNAINPWVAAKFIRAAA